MATVKIPDDEMSDLVTEHLAEDLGRCDGEFLGEADLAAIEMDPAQGAAKPPTPYDPHAHSEVWETPPVSQVPEQVVHADPQGPAVYGHHPRDANTP